MFAKLRSLFSGWSVPGWVTLVFFGVLKSLDWLGRLDELTTWGGKVMPFLAPCIRWATSGAGQTIILFSGLALLFVSTWQKNIEKNVRSEKAFIESFFRPGPRRSMLIAILIGAVVGGGLAGITWKIASAAAPQAPTFDLADSLAEPHRLEKPPLQTEPLFTKPLLPSDEKACRFRIFEYDHLADYDIDSLKVKPEWVLFNEEPYALHQIASGFIGTDGILCIDATIYGGVIIRGNRHSKLPSGWDINRNDFAVEIVNDKGVPMYSVRRLRPTLVELRGVLMMDAGQSISLPAEGTLFGCKIFRLDRYGATPPPGTIPDKARRIFKYPAQLYPGKLEDDEQLKLPW